MKILARIIIIIAIFFIGFYTGQQYLPDTTPVDEQPVDGSLQNAEQITASLMLDYGNGKIETFNNVVLAKNTNSVFDLLEKVTTENEIELKSKDYDGELGVFIESIGEQKSDFTADQFWQYWVNNEYAKIGASNHKLEDGDVVEWKFTKGQFNN